MASSFLSVIIPVFNEERTLRPLLEKVDAVRIDGHPLEILIVNDGSTDATPDILRQWRQERDPASPNRVILLEKPNGGKGSAVRMGIEHSTGGAVIIQDADLEYDPADYADCALPVFRGECKVVYGTREDANRNRIFSSPGYYLGALSLTFWVNLLFNANLTDEATCYKTFDGELIRHLPLEGDHFEWEPEVTAKLLRLGYTIREVPVRYLPRKVSEGKKIRFRDGLQGFAAAFRWRFRSLKQTQNVLSAQDAAAARQIRHVRCAQTALFAVVLIAILVRLLYAIPAMQDPSLVMRLDSPSYLNPARSLLETGRYAEYPGGPLTAIRTPLYACYLALCLWLGNGSLTFCIIMSCILGGLIACPVYLTARLVSSWKVSFFAALLFALNPTAVAQSPMFLSDTLFTAVIAFQTMFFLKFVKCRFALFFFVSVFFAALGVLVRQANMLWILPCLFVLWVLPRFPVRLKLWYSLFAALIFAVLPGAWLIRNHAIGAGYRLDAMQGNMMLHHVSIMESRRTGQPEPVIRERRKAEFEAVFQADPVRFARLSDRLDHQEKSMSAEMLSRPAEAIRLYLHPYTLLPDLPSFLENLGLSKGDKGTMDVLNREGLAAAVRHYFGGRYAGLLLCLPFLICAGILYLLSGLCLLKDIWRRQWFRILLFLLLAEYYLFLPGAVPMPRYQLPALLFLCVMAADFISGWIRRISSSEDGVPADRIR